MSSNVDGDFYELLGLTPEATQEEIRQAYRRLVRTVHPDMGGSAALFRLVQQAYETLGDPTERAAYDNGIAPVSFAPDAYDPGPDYHDDDHEYGYTEGPDPGWGSEYVYDANDGHGWEYSYVGADPPALRPWHHRWTRGRGGLATTVTSAAITTVLFTVVAYMLILRLDWIRPDEARPDLLLVVLGQPALTGIAVTIYGGVLLYSIWMGDFGLLLWRADVAVIVGLATWPLFYWDIATGTEQTRYWWILAVWVTYRISVLVTTVVLEKDI